MDEKVTRLTVLAELLSCIDNLNYWKYTPDMELVRTNCQDSIFFVSVFKTSGCQAKIDEHFRANNLPIVFSDSLGFTWLAAAEKIEGILRYVYVLGPTFHTELLEKNLEEKMRHMNLSLQYRRETLSQIQTVPVVAFDTFLQYGVMLQFCISGERISRTEIVLEQPQTPAEVAAMDNWKNNRHHGTWHFEQTLMQLVTDGNINQVKILYQQKEPGRCGTMCPGDPLRQAKDEIIVMTALVTRAAIRGGLGPETAYTISDYYIQMVEDANTVSAVYALAEKIQDDFIHRVHKIKSMSTYSSLIIRCMDYVSWHVSEKISIREIANYLGYAEYYLTSRFKKETGENLRDYINRQKIEQAKQLLKNTNLGIQEIGDQLCLSSASYFTAVFHKFAGTSPSEYRANRE